MATETAGDSPGWRWVARVTGDDFDPALRLTLVALLLSPIGGPGLRPLLLVLPAAGLVLPALLRSAWFWGALAALTGVRVALDWPLADNHAYLLAYWCLAVSLSLAALDARRALRWNARALIGCVFAFATVWKLISPDFLDGSFLGATLLLDPRFADAAAWIGDLSPQQIDAAGALLLAHVDGVPPSDVAGVALPARLWLFARAATFSTLALEASVAIAFLWPGGRGPARVRNAALLTFAVVTYAVATVAGFGWLLLALGLAQCEPGRTRTRLAYLAAFALVLLYREVPWLAWIAERVAPPP